MRALKNDAILLRVAALVVVCVMVVAAAVVKNQKNMNEFHLQMEQLKHEACEPFDYSLYWERAYPVPEETELF